MMCCHWKGLTGKDETTAIWIDQGQKQILLGPWPQGTLDKDAGSLCETTGLSRSRRRLTCQVELRSAP